MVTQESFGSLVRRYRREAELTQEALAERAGLSVRAIRTIETESGYRPRQDTVRLLLAALAIPPSEQAGFLTAAAQVAEQGEVVHTEPQHLPTGGFAGSLPAGTMVGREAELALVQGAVDAVAQSDGRLVLLAGEPGVGKTRLVQEVTVAVQERGFLLAAGRCYEPEQTVPYYPFLDALAMLYAAAPEPMKREAAQRWLYLGVLLPDHLPVPARDTGSGQDEQQRVCRSVTGFLELLAGTQPLAILLDDLHWADSASLMLLLHLARHTRMLPLLLLGTYRTVEVGRSHPLEGALRDLQREGLMQRVEVHRLDQEGTAALVAATLGAEAISREFSSLMYGRTEGNPYFVHQVLQVLVERGDLFRTDGQWDRRAIDQIAVPESIRSVVGQRLSQLSAAAQEVLQDASVLGQSFAFPDLLAIAGCTERAVEDALDEAEQAGLIHDLGHDQSSFDHALSQQAIYAELSSRRKRRLHLAIGEALARLPERQRAGRVAEIAWHYLQGDDAEYALAWSLRAGDAAAALFAYSDAEAQYRTAAGLAQDLGDEQRALDAWDRLGDVLYRAARYDDAIGTLERVVALVDRVQDQERYLGLVARIGQAHGGGGSAVVGIERLEPVVHTLEAVGITDRPSAHAADLYGTLAMLYFQSGRWQDVEPAAIKAIAQAEASRNEPALCFGEVFRGIGLFYANCAVEAQHALARATEIAGRLEDPWLLSLALFHVGVPAWFLGQLADGEACMRQGITCADHAALVDLATFQRTTLAGVLIDRGRWSEARAEVERAVEDGRSLGSTWSNAYPLYTLGHILLLQGERNKGLQYVQEGLALATRADDLQLAVQAQLSLARHEIREGRAKEALARLEPFLGHSLGYASNWHLPIYAWAQLEAGNEAHAEDVLASVREQVMAGGARRDLATVLLVSAKLAAQQGRWDDAIAELEAGLALTREIGLPYVEAQLLHDYGHLELTRGNHEQARSRLEAALAIFQRLGARPDVEMAEHTLANLDTAPSITQHPAG
jgi:tetratricopeptide (TPR) repeat protein/transcriptional regulator with XRE-family HTH domain